jgi:sulfatase maturation enzyme AslB (radical SAM superfamily)
VELTRREAGLAGTGWHGYLSTNGVMPESDAVWLARQFSRVSLSCDGPPDIQDRQRPLRGGAASSAAVAATARVLLAETGRLDVRATITPATGSRQGEILLYLRDVLGATHVRFEPVYRAGPHQPPPFQPDEAIGFARHFLDAEAAACASGVDLSVSGVRIDEIHGPYCDVLRQTLRLTPAGTATACFHCTDPGEAASAGLEIGRLDPGTGRFALDPGRIAELRAEATRIPEACQGCVNVLHCTRGCPDFCPLCPASPAEQPGAGFRCRLYQRLAEAWLDALLA